MSDELQKIGFGSNRTLMTVTALVIREPTWNRGAKEMILLDNDGATFFHFPSEERLGRFDGADHIGAETPVSGAALIGVDTTNFAKLTGDVTLQVLLDEIDGLFDNTVLRDGTKTLTGEWDIGGIFGITNLFKLHGNDTLPSLNTIAGREGFSWGQSDAEFFDITDLASNSLNDGNFTSTTTWTFGGGWSDNSGNAKYTDSGADGDLEQTDSDLFSLIIGLRWYELTYTIISDTGPSNATYTIPTSLVPATITLDTTVGTHKIYFKLKQLPTTTSFKINAASGSGGGSTVWDDLLFKEVIGGDVSVNNILNVHNRLNITTGPSGISALGSSNDFVIESEIAAGISILSSNASFTSLTFGSPLTNKGLQLQWQPQNTKAVLGTRLLDAFLEFQISSGFVGMTLDKDKNLSIEGLTASRLMSIDSGKKLVSLSKSSAYTSSSTPDRTLLAEGSATTLNNNKVLAAMIADLKTADIFL